MSVVDRAPDDESVTTKLKWIAKEDIGVSDTLLRNLIHCEETRLRWDTARLLEEWLRPERRRELHRCLYSPQVWRMRCEYMAYVERELRRVRCKRYAKHELVFTPRVKKKVDSFRRSQKARSFPYSRVELGELRVFDSICGWPRLRASLDEVEVLEHVSMGFKRERALLEHEAKVLALILEAPPGGSNAMGAPTGA